MTTDQPHPRAAKSLARSNVRDNPPRQQKIPPTRYIHRHSAGEARSTYIYTRVPFPSAKKINLAQASSRFSRFASFFALFRDIRKKIKNNKTHSLTAALDNDFQSRIHQRPDVARGETHAILPGVRLFQHPDGQSGIGYGRTHFHALDERSGRSRRRRRRRRRGGGGGRGGGDVAAALLLLLLLLLSSSVEGREQSHRRVGGAGPGGSASGDAAAMVIVVMKRRMMRDRKRRIRRRRRRRRRRWQVEPRGRIDGGGEEDDDDDDRRDDSHYF